MKVSEISTSAIANVVKHLNAGKRCGKIVLDNERIPA